MAIEISVKILGDRELAQTLARLSANDIPKAIRDGVRYAARGASTSMAKEIGKISPVKAARIKQDLRLMMGPDGLSARILASSNPMSALQFRPRQVRRGLALTFYRGERTLIPSGFMQTSRAQHWRGKLPFKATSAGTYSGDTRRSKPRKQMEFVHGISLASLYLGGKHKDQIQSAVEERVAEQLEKGIIRSLGGMGRGFGKAR